MMITSHAPSIGSQKANLQPKGLPLYYSKKIPIILLGSSLSCVGEQEGSLGRPGEPTIMSSPKVEVLISFFSLITEKGLLEASESLCETGSGKSRYLISFFGDLPRT
jgi:hypothetical protein